MESPSGQHEVQAVILIQRGSSINGAIAVALLYLEMGPDLWALG